MTSRSLDADELLTAIQQQFGPGAEQGYLQYRLLQEATLRSQEQDWRDLVPAHRMLTGLAIPRQAMS